MNWLLEIIFHPVLVLLKGKQDEKKIVLFAILASCLCGGIFYVNVSQNLFWIISSSYSLLWFATFVKIDL